MSGLRIGLALGGGSARGLAHIPLLEVFDELGVKPAVICGCSIGALIGAGYAAGLSAREIKERAELILTSRTGAMRYVFGARGMRLRDLFDLKSLSSLHIKGEQLARLALPEAAPERIEDLAIPFKAVATDYGSGQEAVFAAGPLVPAVAASIAIPGVIISPLIDGRLMVDGGLCNPVPFDHARQGSDVVVAVDVSGRPSLAEPARPANRELAIGSLLIMFHQVAELRRAASPPDIYIEPALDAFRAHDFFRLKDLFAAAEPAKDQLKRELEARLRAAG